MNRDAILDKGERVFVLTVAMVLGAETLFTVMAAGQQFAWPRLLLGVFGAVFIIYLAQRLFVGDRTMATVGLAWAGFQIVLMAASLVVGPDPREGSLGILQSVGTPIRYMALLKGIAYASFAWVLITPCCAQAFLADRRGDDVAKFASPAVVDEGGPLAWSPDQLQRVGNLAGWMTGAAVALMAVGLWMVLGSIPRSLIISKHQALIVIEGLLLLGLGGCLLGPAFGMANIPTPEGQSQGDLKTAARSWTLWHLALGGVCAALTTIAVLRYLLF